MSPGSDPTVQCAKVAIRDAIGCTDNHEVRRYLDEALQLLDGVEEADAGQFVSVDAAELTDNHRN